MTSWVAFDGKDCSGCKHLNERGYCEFTACIIPCVVKGYIPETRKTNADRIRSMTDEELAVLLEGCICPSDPCKKVVNRGKQPDKKICQSCWLDWLKKEAEDGE